MISHSSNTGSRHGFQTDDAALRPIAAKVEAGERLNFDDGVALYRSGDILAVGWMANAVRERMQRFLDLGGQTRDGERDLDAVITKLVAS